MHLRKLKKKQQLYKIAEQENLIRKFKPKTKKLVKMPNKSIKSRITKDEGYELLKAFKLKKMGVKEIQDTMLVLFDITSSKDLNRTQFDLIWKMIMQANNDLEYRNLLTESLW